MWLTRVLCSECCALFTISSSNFEGGSEEGDGFLDGGGILSTTFAG